MTLRAYEAAQEASLPLIVARSLRTGSTGTSRNASDPRGWLAAIVDGSGDAIIGEDLDGTIQSWNGGAIRLLGYSANEVIGRKTAILIPEDRLDEEPESLAQIQCGRRIEPLETTWQRKDGSLVDISLAISPIRDEDGAIVGVSRIAHDLTERLMAWEQQRLLIGEMHHRMKNLFVLADAIVSISASSNGSERDVIDDIRGRLSSLARAHSLSAIGCPAESGKGRPAPLLLLIRRILDPYAADGRVAIEGHDCDVGGNAVIHLARLLYELAANAAKFGSLSVGSGRLEISVASDGDRVDLVWRETGGPVPSNFGPAGFGSRLERGLANALRATIKRDWRLTGLVVTIAMPKAVLAT